jgi:hypothetical protein
MMPRSRGLWLAIALVLIMALAACGGDDNDNDNGDANQDDSPTPTAETDAAAGTPQLDLNLGPQLEVGGAADSEPAEAGLVGRLPGCSDPDAEDCPSPVNLPLDEQATGDGITVSYLSRYFAPAEDTPDDVAIRIVPGERFPFQEQAEFDVYRADSVESAISVIEATDSGEWTSGQGWNGTIAVQKDNSQDPQVNTSIGAFELPDGGVIVLRAVTTGQYGWDLWSVIYEQMLNSLVVEPADAAGS